MKKSSGFTLVEILVGIFVFALLCTAAFLVFSYGLKVSIYNSTRVQLQRNASIAMERMLTEAKDAVFLPWQQGTTAVSYSPKTPPSPVFCPFINQPDTDPDYDANCYLDPNHVNDPNNSIFCFTAPVPSVTGASNFDYARTENYRLVCYYVDSDYVPTAGQSTISNTYALIRRTMKFNTTLPDTIFDTDWTFINPNPRLWDWDVVDPNSTPEIIIQMPFPSDSITFNVTHEPDPEYLTSRRIEFQNASQVYRDLVSGTTTAYSPLSFKITMNLIQYPYGKKQYRKQEVKMDGSVNIRSSYH